MEGDPPPSNVSEGNNDTIPTSTTDADIVMTTLPVLDDPISSSSGTVPAIKEGSSSNRAPSIDTDDELLEMNMSCQPSEKITENVDDLVNDLETLLGESSDSISNVADDLSTEVSTANETALEADNQETIFSNTKAEELPVEEYDSSDIHLQESNKAEGDPMEDVNEASNIIEGDNEASESMNPDSVEMEKDYKNTESQPELVEEAQSSDDIVMSEPVKYKEEDQVGTDTDQVTSNEIIEDDENEAVKSTDESSIVVQASSEDAEAVHALEKIIDEETESAVSSIEGFMPSEIADPQVQSSTETDETDIAQIEQDTSQGIAESTSVYTTTEQIEQSMQESLEKNETTGTTEEEAAIQGIIESNNTYSVEQEVQEISVPKITDSGDVCDPEITENEAAVQGIMEADPEPQKIVQEQLSIQQSNEEVEPMEVEEAVSEDTTKLCEEESNEVADQTSVVEEEMQDEPVAEPSVDLKEPEEIREMADTPEEIDNMTETPVQENVCSSQINEEIKEVKTTQRSTVVLEENRQQIPQNQPKKIEEPSKEDQVLLAAVASIMEPSISEEQYEEPTSSPQEPESTAVVMEEPEKQKKTDNIKESTGDNAATAVVVPKEEIKVEPVVEKEEIKVVPVEKEKEASINAEVTVEEQSVESKEKEELKPKEQEIKQSTPIETHTQPLSISVDEDKEDVQKEEASKSPQKTQEQECSKGSLKITITKHSDKMHSILKVYDPEEKQTTVNEEESHEEPIPKLIIKSKQQQSSPKTSGKKNYSPPMAAASSGGALSPLKITLKNVGKPEETSKRGSPKLTVKDDPEVKHQSPRITIKRIPKPESDPEEQHVTSTPKVTIKPVKRPLDVTPEEKEQDEEPSQKVSIRATKSDAEEDAAATHSPKITIKPIKKSDDESQSSPRSKSDDHEEKRIVLKINKGSVCSKETKKRESQPPEEEKLAKIKLKFSKGGGHPHIVSDSEEVRKHTKSDEVDSAAQDTKTESREAGEVERLTQSDGSNGSKESKKKEEPAKVEEPPVAMDTTPVVLPTPTPKKRGRPRKNPLIPREDSKELPTYVNSPKLNETSSPAPSPAPSPSPSCVDSTPTASRESTPTATPTSEGRPKRSCRGQNVIATLGIKPRKSRGRGRGSKANMGDRLPSTETPDDKDTSSQHSDMSQISDPESTKTPDIEPPKRGRGRRRKTSDPHKDTASDTSSVISEAISLLDEEDHAEPKTKVSKEEEKVDPEAEEKLKEIEEAKARRRETLLNNLAKARSKRKSQLQKKTEAGSKSKEEAKEEKEKEEAEPDNKPTTTDDQKQQEEVNTDSKSVVENVALPVPTKQLQVKVETFGDVDVARSEEPVPDKQEKTKTTPVSSPEKPKGASSKSSVMDTSRGLQESLVDEETRMSADQGTYETSASPAKQAKPAALSSEVAAEDSQSSLQSTGTTESGKTGNSAKNSRTRLEVNHELDSNVVTVDQMAEYYWDNTGPFMLQEQVSLYLGVTSFKRKYPNIIRRAVDMQERDYIRENGFASEAMCNLGLTAVNSHDIIEIMFRDFQDKYEEYCRFTQEKQTKELLSKQKVLSQTSILQKNFDKTELMEQAIQSTLQWNKEFNKARLEHRKASMDLQTFTIQYPKGRTRHIKKANIGCYPVALVPGQFTDYYKDLTATEINNLPLNSLGTGYLGSSDVDSDSSDGDSDSSSSSSSSDYSSDEDCKLCAKHNTQTAAVKTTTT